MGCRVTVRNKYRDPEKNLKDAMNEFRRRVEDSGVMQTLRDKQHYESKGLKKKKKQKDSARKYKQSNLEERVLAGEKVNASAGVINKIKAKNSKRR